MDCRYRPFHLYVSCRAAAGGDVTTMAQGLAAGLVGGDVAMPTQGNPSLTVIGIPVSEDLELRLCLAPAPEARDLVVP